MTAVANDANDKIALPATFVPPASISKKRPSNPLNKWIKERKGSYQFTRKDVEYIWRNVIFSHTHKQLKDMYEDEDKRDKLPALVVAIIAGYLGDVARGRYDNIKSTINIVFPALRDFEHIDDTPDMGGYNQIVELENRLRRLEGDDGIMIVDKLVEAEYVEVPE